MGAVRRHATLFAANNVGCQAPGPRSISVGVSCATSVQLIGHGLGCGHGLGNGFGYGHGCGLGHGFGLGHGHGHHGTIWVRRVTTTSLPPAALSLGITAGRSARGTAALTA